MRIFYSFLLWLSECELAYALKSGRNKASVALIRGDIVRWQDALDQCEIKSKSLYETSTS